MIDRRVFLRASVAGMGAIASFSAFGGPILPSSRMDGHQGPFVLSAVDDAGGGHFIAGIDRQGNILFRLPVPERGHGGCRRPFANQVVMFSRRPGRHYQVIDFRNGELVRQINAEKDHHFYGHGVFSTDGKLLYATANHYPTGKGRILVYDAEHEYRMQGSLEVDGIGPHEVRLHPDGRALVVALGGIKTHPDYDRIKLNLSDMQPALLLVDRFTGRTLQRHEPSHHQLSCRHLDVSKEGIVVAGYQFEGPVWESPPLIARLDTAKSAFSELVLPAPDQASLNNYIASVAIDPASHLVALTAPRGNRAVLLDYMTSEHLSTIDITDVAGAIADRQGAFMFSSGAGGLFRSRASRANPIGSNDLRWDNHLTAIEVARG